MTKPLTISLITLLILATGAGLWYTQKDIKNTQDVISQNTTTQTNVTASESVAVQDDVIDADVDTKTDGEVSTDDTILYNPDGAIDTSNWQTYTNEEYGFSVKYPGGWEIGFVKDRVEFDKASKAFQYLSLRNKEGVIASIGIKEAGEYDDVEIRPFRTGVAAGTFYKRGFLAVDSTTLVAWQLEYKGIDNKTSVQEIWYCNVTDDPNQKGCENILLNNERYFYAELNLQDIANMDSAIKNREIFDTIIESITFLR